MKSQIKTISLKKPFFETVHYFLGLRLTSEKISFIIHHEINFIFGTLCKIVTIVSTTDHFNKSSARRRK